MSFRYLGIILILGMCCLACQETDEPIEKKRPVISLDKIEIRELLHSDAQTITYTQTYHYDESARLVCAEMSQSFTAVDPQEINDKVELTYSAHQVDIKDGTGHQWIYQLDSNHGQAISCLYRPAGGSERYYWFEYMKSTDGKCYLSEVIETIQGESEPFATLSFNYTHRFTPLVTKRMNGYEQQFKMNFYEGENWMNAVQLPPLFIAELYPLSLHREALYAHLLGDYPDTLLESVTPVESLYDEYCTYSYRYQEEYPISCEICTCSEGKEFVRQLSLAYEK